MPANTPPPLAAAARALGRAGALVAGLLLAAAPPAGAVEVDGPEDFGAIAKNGFYQVVAGGFPALVNTPANCSPTATAQDCRRNSYAWSMAFDGGYLKVGTARDVACFLPNADPNDPTCFDGLVPEIESRAEIWRYTPAGNGGLNGSWSRIFQSPDSPYDWKCLELFGPGLQAVLDCLASPPPMPFVPNDIGYRNMELCDAGTPGQPHLFVATSGLPGRILYQNGTTSFVPASKTGLRSTLLDLISFDVDVGYRSLVCFKNKLWTSPAASLKTGDTDVSDRPVILVNADPTSPDEPWMEASLYGFTDDQTDPNDPPSDNLGVFEMETFDPDMDGEPDYLVAGTFNRTTGAEVWWTDGTGCDDVLVVADPNAYPYFVLGCVWTKILDGGAGRPTPQAGFPAALNDVVVGPDANAVVGSMGQFGPYLYLSLTEAAAVEKTYAELIRIDGAGQWELVMGAPRPAPAMVGPTPALPNDNLCTPTNVDGTDYCLPISGLGLGFGDTPVVTPPRPASFSVGRANYVWRLEEHAGELFGGTLDLVTAQPSEFGFDLWKTADGATWSSVVFDGLGNDHNYGVRNLLSTAYGLVLGTANPYTADPAGGLEIWLAPGGATALPTADAGPDFTAFDDGVAPDPTPADHSVTFTLDGSASFDPLGGTITTWGWYVGDLTAGPCDVGVATPFAATAVAPRTEPTGDPYTPYTYTLRIVDNDANVACDAIAVLASFNLAPTATIATDPPLVPGPLPRVALVDFDGNGSETFTIDGGCSDPEASLASCLYTTIDPGLLFVPPAAEDATVTALSEALLAGGDTSPDVQLTALDTVALSHTARIDVKVETLFDNVELNNPPECASGWFYVKKNTLATLDPTGPLTRRCIDVDNLDGDLSYEIVQPAGVGTAGVGSLTYEPAADFTGEDLFTYRALDLAAAASAEVAAGIRVIECDGLDVYAEISEAFPGPGPTLREGCYSLLATSSTVQAPDAVVTLRAGAVVALGNNFVVQSGGKLTVELDPGLLTP